MDQLRALEAKVSQEGVPEPPRGQSTLGSKPIGKGVLAKDNNPVPETQSHLKSMAPLSYFKNPDPPISVPKLRDDAYYTAMADALVAPAQDDVEEQQTFLATIYQVIEAKLAEEDGIFLASDADIMEQKWSPLAPDADLLSANVINQEWARSHSHGEFLREQARLNNLVAAQWQVFWTANLPDCNTFL
ncbi:hypothetical protein AX15_001406, partial [Amanita polypyramis BW_CC]